MDESELTTGDLLALLLLGPRRLRGMDFEVQVDHYSDWQRQEPGRAPVSADPVIIRVETLSVADGRWHYAKHVPEADVFAERSSQAGVGLWWDLPYAGLIEHLEPALVLSSLCGFHATCDRRGCFLRATPRTQGDIDAAAVLVDCDADVWQCRVDPRWGVLLEVDSWSDWKSGFRSVLQWRIEPHADPEASQR